MPTLAQIQKMQIRRGTGHRAQENIAKHRKGRSRPTQQKFDKTDQNDEKIQRKENKYGKEKILCDNPDLLPKW